MADLPFGERIANLRTTVPGPRSRDLAERLRRVECRNITYLADDFPVFWERAAGANVVDADGNLFVDFTSAFGVASLGHTPPAVTNAIAAQLEKLPHGMGDVHPPSIKVELLEKLASLFPEPGAQAILCSSGAEAVEAAIKTAYLATKRPDLVVFEGAYHGLTYGTLAVSGLPRFREPFAQQLAKISHTVPLPRSTEESIRQIGSVLRSAEIGAVLVEPIFGRAGVVVPPDGWLRALRRLTADADVLLIADEMMTGFGRTGTRFAIDREGIVPDLLCVGKALTGTLPFSACIGTKKAMAAWPLSDGEALHTSTFLGHPLGCAAALASIDEIERRNLSARAEELGTIALREIERWITPTSIVTSVRGRGLMIGIELCRPGLAFECAKKALQRGLIVLPSGPSGNVVSLTPPLTISERQLRWGLETLRALDI
ncbi:MAG: aspartate aminotransferase family protein [Pseudomonadota bacterium]